MESTGRDRPGALPSGPHPTAGPATVGMPRWPGPLLIVGGGMVALGALTTATFVTMGELPVADPRPLVWLALAGGLAFVTGLVYSAVRQVRIRRHLGPDRYRGPSVFLLIAMVFVVAAVATAPFAADAAILLEGEGDVTTVGSVVILLSTQAALLLVSWAFVFRPRALVAFPSLPGREPVRALRLGLGWGIVAWVGATLVTAGVAAALEAAGLEVDPQAAEQAIRVLDPWLVVVAIVIVAPFAEELFFRGVVFNAWLREGGRRWAYLGSAALFAVIHLSLVTVLPIFLLGLALAWIYRRTASLLAPIAMHATVNGISVALALLVRFEVLRLPV